MPHVSEGAGGDDLDQEGTDEIKVYEDEGGEDEKRSENLTEEKSSLIDLTESEEKGGNGQTYSSTKNATRSDLSPVYGKLEPTPHSSSYSMGFLVPPYTYHNGAAAGSIPVSMASKIGLAGSHPFFCPGGDPLGQPPPAHMGIPPYQLDPKGAGELWRVPRTWKGIGPLLAASGITRPAMYPFSSAQYAYPMLSPDMSQVASWHSPSMYPIGSPGSGFRSPYPSSLPITNTTLSSDLYRFSPTGLIPPHPHAPHHPHPHPGLGSPHALSSHQLASSAAVVTPGPKQELGGHPGSGHPGSGHTGAHGDHNHRGRVSHRKCERFEMESVPEKWWCEQPLDLVKKKIPVAVVAPSAILKRVDDGEEAKSDQEVIKREEVDWTPKYGGLPPYDSGVGTPVGTHSLTPARRETTDIGLQGDDKISQIALQSPNLYSALCKEPISDLSEKKKETPPVSAAHMEMLDKLTAEYVQKMAVQGVPDALKPDGLYSMIHRLAALEHKFLSALYMGSLANPSLAGYSPAPGSTLPAVGLSQGLSPPLVAGMSPRVPTPTGLLGSLPLPYLSPTMLPYQNFLMPPSYSDPRQGNADSQSRLKQMFPVSPSPNSLIENSGSSTKSTEDFVSSSSSVRSSSASSPLDLALSPMSSVRASPPLTPQSSGHRRPASAKRSSMDHQKNSTTGSSESKNQDSANASNNQDKKKPHIKKPLNAFMLYMKEMRSKVVAECTLKESAAINQILGRRWHSLTREEQAKYYEKARHERQLHMQLYPAWSARDNYGYGAKKKKRKKERVPVDAVGGNNMKKCRARYGLDQQSQWCKPCRRKKKCIRYMEAVGGGGGMDDGNQSDDNLGSCGSVGDGDAHTPLDDDDHEDGDDTESMSQSHSLSSPGALSGFSSLTSPSMILPSPSTSLASPSVSLASPGMSLQSPLTPLEYDCKPPQMPLSLPLSLPMYNQHSPLLGPPLNRQKVGTNPHDINNPLSVNQLTGKCIKTEAGVSASGNGGSASGNSNSNDSSSRAIRVT